MKAKVVLVGAAHSGKTSLAHRYINFDFNPHTTTTTQPAISQKKVFFNGKEFLLEIWDTAGQEQYHALSPMYYRDADIGIVVFDLTDSSSFQKSRQWVNELRQARGDSITIMLAGNKLDLASIRTVSLDSMNQFAQQIGVESFETSAKTGENIELLFSSIVKSLNNKNSGLMTLGSKKNRSSVKFDDTYQTESNCKC